MQRDEALIDDYLQFLPSWSPSTPTWKLLELALQHAARGLHHRPASPLSVFEEAKHALGLALTLKLVADSRELDELAWTGLYFGPSTGRLAARSLFDVSTVEKLDKFHGGMRAFHLGLIGGFTWIDVFGQFVARATGNLEYDGVHIGENAFYAPPIHLRGVAPSRWTDYCVKALPQPYASNDHRHWFMDTMMRKHLGRPSGRFAESILTNPRHPFYLEIWGSYLGNWEDAHTTNELKGILAPAQTSKRNSEAELTRSRASHPVATIKGMLVEPTLFAMAVISAWTNSVMRTEIHGPLVHSSQLRPPRSIIKSVADLQREALRNLPVVLEAAYIKHDRRVKVFGATGKEVLPPVETFRHAITGSRIVSSIPGFPNSRVSRHKCSGVPDLQYMDYDGTTTESDSLNRIYRRTISILTGQVPETDSIGLGSAELALFFASVEMEPLVRELAIEYGLSSEELDFTSAVQQAVQIERQTTRLSTTTLSLPSQTL